LRTTLSVAPDHESYETTKLDLKNQDDLKFLEKALDWTLEIDGLAWADGECRVQPYRFPQTNTDYRRFGSCRKELQVKSSRHIYNLALYAYLSGVSARLMLPFNEYQIDDTAMTMNVPRS
jgi:hypothetical protein